MKSKATFFVTTDHPKWGPKFWTIRGFDKAEKFANELLAGGQVPRVRITQGDFEIILCTKEETARVLGS